MNIYKIDCGDNRPMYAIAESFAEAERVVLDYFLENEIQSITLLPGTVLIQEATTPEGGK